MDLVVLVSVEWDVDWIPTGWWNDGHMSIVSSGVGQESSRRRLGNGKNGEEP